MELQKSARTFKLVAQAMASIGQTSTKILVLKACYWAKNQAKVHLLSSDGCKHVNQQDETPLNKRLQADRLRRGDARRVSLESTAAEARAVGRTREAIRVVIMLYNIRQCNLGEASA